MTVKIADIKPKQNKQKKKTQTQNNKNNQKNPNFPKSPGLSLKKKSLINLKYANQKQRVKLVLHCIT